MVKEFDGNEKDWERHFMIVELFEKGVSVEEIARIVGLTKEEVDEFFPRLY